MSEQSNHDIESCPPRPIRFPGTIKSMYGKTGNSFGIECLLFFYAGQFW